MTAPRRLQWAVRRTVRRRELALAGALALVFGAAPTVGDIGACGRTATDLDAPAFALARKQLDCQRCTECGLTTGARTGRTCLGACDPNTPSDVGFPATCHPLAHDGEVCLRALGAASCADYAAFVDDVAPTVPSECDFCLLVPDGGIPAGDP